MTWTYKALVGADACVLAFSLLLAVSALTTSRSSPEEAVLLGLTALQALGFYSAAKAKRVGKVSVACSILLAQLVIAGGLLGAWLALMVAAFPS